MTSFPVPVSPRTKTAQFTGATMFISSRTARNFGLDPIKSEIAIVLLLGRQECLRCNAMIHPAWPSWSTHHPREHLAIHANRVHAGGVHADLGRIPEHLVGAFQLNHSARPALTTGGTSCPSKRNAPVAGSLIA